MIRLLAVLLFVAIPFSAVLAQPGIRPFGTPAPAPSAAAPSATVPAVVQNQPADPVVVGQLEHLGWSLTGPSAKHYIFGGLAVADYVWQGKRRIVTLQEHTDLPKPDENYLYYHELRDGNWWAFRKHPWPDRTYSVWFRPGDVPGAKWQRLQMARIQVSGP
ncbi:hypothetical protein [Anatilimnocola floriformis]|uniref:hypothetical protein n=1 Tax=Anatilimnocola floriformis TaxID=2948575 RepID=UPI0020C37F9B|nr:hypothetical protein [Anatilimnocola floriformis]